MNAGKLQSHLYDRAGYENHPQANGSDAFASRDIRPAFSAYSLKMER